MRDMNFCPFTFPCPSSFTVSVSCVNPGLVHKDELIAREMGADVCEIVRTFRFVTFSGDLLNLENK
jgi:hypothetical protein